MYGLLLLGGTVTDGVEKVSEDDEMVGMPVAFAEVVAEGMSALWMKVNVGAKKDVDSVMGAENENGQMEGKSVHRETTS